MTEKTTVQISKKLRDRLDSIKRHPRETYDEVIQKILSKHINWRYLVSLGEDPRDPDLTENYRTYLETLEDIYDVELTDYGSMVYETHDYTDALEVAKKSYDIYLESFPNKKQSGMSLIHLETLPHCMICDRHFSISHKYCPYCGNSLEVKLRLDIPDILKEWEIRHFDDEVGK